jgi:hypothetical protein
LEVIEQITHLLFLRGLDEEPATSDAQMTASAAPADAISCK